MSFFGKSLSSLKIEIDYHAISSTSPEMLKRLDRIENNYSKLAKVLTELELKFELDDRLAALISDEADTENCLPKKPR